MITHKTMLREYLEMMRKFVDSHTTDNVYGFILDHGREFTPQPEVPKGARRVQRECFKNANLLAGRFDLRYVEGFAWRAELPLAFHHAWCVNDADEVVDPTWDNPMECEYMGVVVPLQVLRPWTMSRGYGCLDSRQFVKEWKAIATENQTETP